MVPWVAPEAAASNSTEQLMQPLLRRMGYRSLKQFEAAYAEFGNAVPWLKRKAFP